MSENEKDQGLISQIEVIVEVHSTDNEEKVMKVNSVADHKAFQSKVIKVYDKFRPNIGDDLFNQVLQK